MSTGELVDAAASIAAELARRETSASPALCMEQAETLARAGDQQESALAALIGRVDASAEMRRWGLPSTLAWLRTRMGMREVRARERLHLARQSRRLPEVTRRLAAGDLSYGYASTIGAAVARLNDDDCAAAEEILLSWPGRASPPGRSPPSATRSPTSSPNATASSWRPIPTPGAATSGPGSTQLVHWTAAATSRAGSTPKTPRSGTGRSRPGQARGHRRPPRPVRTHCGRVDERPVGRARATRVTVICDLDTLTGGQAPARLTDGTPIPAAQARRIALAAGVSALILGQGNIPLYLGHRQGSPAPPNGRSSRRYTRRARFRAAKSPERCAKSTTSTAGPSATAPPTSTNLPSVAAGIIGSNTPIRHK